MISQNVTAAQKKALANRVGARLTQEHGTRKYYTRQQVENAVRDEPLDLHCWAMCLFEAPPDFIAYHTEIGEICDYSAMRESMVRALTDGASNSWFDADQSWLEWPDVDLGSVFDFFDW